MSDSVRPHRRQPTRLPRRWDSPGKNTGVGCHFLLQCMKVKSEREVAQLWPTLCDPMDCSLPGSSVHGIFQARVPEWGVIAFSRVTGLEQRKVPEPTLLRSWDSGCTFESHCSLLFEVKIFKAVIKINRKKLYLWRMNVAIHYLSLNFNLNLVLITFEYILIHLKEIN